MAPAVGGGFGPKFVTYPEEVAIAAAARLVARPVKWIEDRLEHFTATTQERDQYWDVEVAFTTQGGLLGIRGTLVHDHGAYTAYGTALPYNSGTNLLGPYMLPAYQLQIDLALTNKVPVTPTRGAGRPQGTFVMERLLDRMARELALDRAEVRRRNLIGPERMPFVTEIRTRDGAAMTYDSGDYPACQQMVLERVGWNGFAARKEAARSEGRYLGVGTRQLRGRQRSRALRERAGFHRSVGPYPRDHRGERSGSRHCDGAGPASRGTVRCLASRH